MQAPGTMRPFELRDSVDLTSARVASNFQTSNFQTSGEGITSPKRKREHEAQPSGHVCSEAFATPDTLAALRDVHVQIFFDCSDLVVADAAALARHSGFFAGALANAIRYGAAMTVDVRGNEFVSETTMKIAVRFAMEGAGAIADIEDGELVVALARCASFLQMPVLLASVERLLCMAADEANCISLYGLAGELSAPRLAAACTRIVVEHYAHVSAHEDFCALPERLRLRFWRLHALKQHFGVSLCALFADGDEDAPGAAFPDDRTLCAMLRETLAEQRERYDEASWLGANDEGQLRARGYDEDRIAAIRAQPRQRLARQERRLHELERLVSELREAAAAAAADL